MYDKLLHIDTPPDTHLIGYADDTLIICTSNKVDLIERNVNENLFRVKRWLDRRLLHMAVEKTEAVLVTDRRAFRTPIRTHINKIADKAMRTAANMFPL